MCRLSALPPIMLSLLLGSMNCRAQAASVESSGPVILPANTSVILHLTESLYKKDAKPGHPVGFEVGYDVVVNGQIFIQSGTVVTGIFRRIEHTGKGPADVFMDLGPARTVSGEMVRLSPTRTAKTDDHFDPTFAFEFPPMIPVFLVMSVFEKKVLLDKDAGRTWLGCWGCGVWVVAHVAENVALDPAKQKVAQAQYAAKQRAGEVEFCRLLQSRNPESSPDESALFDYFLLLTQFKTQLSDTPGGLDAAIEKIQQTLDEKPDCPELRVLFHALLAELFEQKGDFVRALEELQPALALQSDSPGWHIRLAELFQKKGQFVHAVAEYRTAVQLDPKGEHTREGFVTFLVGSDDSDTALAEIKEAMRIWPDNIYFHYLLGKALVKKNDSEGAIVELQWVLKQEKNHDWRASCALGSAYELKGDLKGALGQYRTAYRVHMDDEKCRAAYERLRLQLKK